MENGNKPIAPCEITSYANGDKFTSKFNGLTKREYFAAMAMQGLLSGRTEFESPMIRVKDAVEMADKLLAELEKPRQ